ncbi:MAG: hypothetical protein WAU47_15265 [Desulfobaccales bacterium]
MKKWIAVFMVMCLGGCAAAPVKAPLGCEKSLVWTSGFMPKGRDLVELGFAALLTAEPKLQNQVKDGAIRGWRLVEGGTLKGAVAELLTILDKHPQYAPLALFALQRLDLEKSLDKCDMEVLLSMFRNIAIYAGARDGDFSDSLANMVNPRH